MKRPPRLAAGRARALGLPTRGTTAPNRLRRVDRWIVGTQSARLRDAVDPLVVDLGYGASPVTTVELADRLADVRRDVRVLGLEIDPDRVAAARRYADPPRLDFARGGFELAGRRPVLVRALNVLRQYEEAAAAEAWAQMCGRLAPGGLLVEGTCDEIGRRACWVALDASGPLTLTFAARVSSLERPSDLAERLPKALIHRNVPGEPVHAFLTAFNRAWAVGAPHAAFGPRQRWAAAVERLAEDGWPVVGGRSRWRLGEVTLRWSAVSSPYPDVPERGKSADSP
ncbi:MAG TPA: class I SAM-dependent methyltransferase [Mycobacteriales bacterium]|nr:class I SAM-dependent methyltransferase [Mycobacteriales bacterium]